MAIEQTAQAGVRVSTGTRAITLVSGAHFLSHFYLLLIPPLFPVLREVYGVGFTALGASITVLSLTSGLTQAAVGFLVDRVGAPRILVAGVLLESLAILLVAVLPWYGALLVLMVAAGLANAAFHPADYAILDAVVAPKRMGRAFSVHTFAGYLGAAIAPAAVLALAAWLGWRAALLACGLAGAALGVAIAANAAWLGRDGGHPRVPSQASARSSIGLLLSAPILMGLLFFAGLSISNHGVASFGVAALASGGWLGLGEAGLALSAYLFAAPVGVLIGGQIADRTARHDAVAVACFALMSAALVWVGLARPGLGGLLPALGLAGLANGVVAPSRDMLIRSLTPAADTGKVFGFVSTGYNLGGILAPLAFGALLDHADPALIFVAAGAVCVLTITTILATASRARRG